MGGKPIWMGRPRCKAWGHAGELWETWIHTRERVKGGQQEALQGECWQMLLAAGFGPLQEPGRVAEMGFGDGQENRATLGLSLRHRGDSIPPGRPTCCPRWLPDTEGEGVLGVP